MRLTFQKSIQILLVAMLMQSVLLLLVQPMTNRFALSRPNLLFISLFLLILLGYASYFSREWRDFKVELRASKRFQHLRYLYFLMIASNAASLVLLCGQSSSELTPLQQLISTGESSCFLIYLSLGMAFAQLLKAWVSSLELSLLAHLLRNLLLILLLPFCL